MTLSVLTAIIGLIPGILWFALVVSVVQIPRAGFLYVVSGGDSGHVSAAKNRIEGPRVFRTGF
ncbi:hypothetical protein GCM10010515_77310 [Streptomyces fructofermentans]|uniref:Uncharacterized protein n=1 Tax=Streptomyces fructofermentans TaxID=152141 RepID=A0A918NVW5_9ACTN|nr:hypothetical protein GCM10010515_77310 [Streptomyces fructofermentans]